MKIECLNCKKTIRLPYGFDKLKVKCEHCNYVTDFSQSTIMHRVLLMYRFFAIMIVIVLADVFEIWMEKHFGFSHGTAFLLGLLVGILLCAIVVLPLYRCLVSLLYKKFLKK